MALYSRSMKVDNTDKKNTRHYSSKQEKQVAKAIGGKPTANSGATPWQKGDVNVSDLKMTIECKTSTKDKDSFTLKKDWFIKNKREMVFMGNDYSIITFSFGPDQSNYYILDEQTFQEFLDFLRNR